MTKIYNKPAIFFILGVLVSCGIFALWKPNVAENVPFLRVPRIEAQSQERPISYAELEAVDTPVTLSRPLEVPEVYVFDRALDDETTQVVVVDSEKMRICVYHIDRLGKIEFVGNRNYQWDLEMDVYNESGLTPSQIKEYYENNRNN